MKILHCADLHLSANEKEYSLSVFQEILQTASEEGCQVVLFCGDLFDSWEDVKKLRREVAEQLRPYEAGMRMILVPGNHERLGAANAEEGFDKVDLGRLEVCSQYPWTLIPLDPQVELLVVPYSKDIPVVQNWEIPPKVKAYRVLAAHGTVVGMVFQGPGEEEEGGALDMNLFQRLQLDYAALGHIHSAQTQRIGTFPVVYPGSARVWRSGEGGRRQVVILTLNGGLTVSYRELQKAGLYHSIPIEVSLDGSLQNYRLPPCLDSADWIQLELIGLTEEERRVGEEVERLRKELEKHCRKVTESRKDLKYIEGISEHPLAQRFLKAWNERYRSTSDEAERKTLQYARVVGLQTLLDVRRVKR